MYPLQASVASLPYVCLFCGLVRVQFGTSHLYVFHHPAEADSSSLKQGDITYEMAQEEIAKNAGLDVDDQAESKGNLNTSTLLKTSFNAVNYTATFLNLRQRINSVPN